MGEKLTKAERQSLSGWGLRAKPLPDRKPQIAFAPVGQEGQIFLACLSASRAGAEENFQAVAYVLQRYCDFQVSGWPIRKVRIEIDE